MSEDIIKRENAEGEEDWFSMPDRIRELEAEVAEKEKERDELYFACCTQKEKIAEQSRLIGVMKEMISKGADLIGGLSDAEWYDHENEESNYIKKTEKFLRELEGK